ncbi:DNA primase family protein [Streptomyces hydrogenans]
MTVTNEAPQACDTCGEPAPFHGPGQGHEFTPAESPKPVTVLPDDDDVVDTVTAWLANMSGVDLGPYLQPPSHPSRVAKRIAVEHSHNAVTTLVYRLGQYWEWTGAHWEPVSNDDMRARLYERTEEALYLRPAKPAEMDRPDIVRDEKGEPFVPAPWTPNRSRIADLNEALQAKVKESDQGDAPMWRRGHPSEVPARTYLPCSNGLLNLETREMRPCTPKLFNLHSVPYDYVSDAPEPTVWLGFLASVWGDDPESIALIQEWFGYVLSGRTDLQKMLVLLGPPRSGKGLMMRILTAMIGAAATAGPTMGAFASNFGMSQLIGKSLAVIADARVPTRDKDQILEKLLMITGEDTVQVDVKHKDPWNGRLPVRLSILSNNIPTFADESGALAARMLVATTTQSFQGAEDRTIEPRILADELPGVLRWALEGYDRLVANGLRFTVPASAENAWTLYRAKAQPVRAFIEERCAVNPEARILKSELYGAWKTWCEDEVGRDKVGTEPTFAHDLYAAYPGIVAKRMRDGGIQRQYYVGVHLAPDTDPTPEPDHWNR